MTAQVPDSVIYDGRPFSLTGTSNPPLWDPEYVGIETVWLSTANYRGYSATYAIAGDVLELARVNVALDLARTKKRCGGKLPQINGVPHSQKLEHGDGSAELTFRNINMPLPYTGGILIATGFIQDLYIHLGYQAAYKFRDVRELIFEEGTLNRMFDRSKEVKLLC